MPCSLLQALTFSEPLWVTTGGNTQGTCRCLHKRTPTASVFSHRRKVAPLEVQDRVTFHLAAETSRGSVPGSAEQFWTTPLTSQHLILLLLHKRSPRLQGPRLKWKRAHGASVKEECYKTGKRSQSLQKSVLGHLVQDRLLLTVLKTDV